MINPQLFELPISRTNFHGLRDIRAIEVRLYHSVEWVNWICPARPSITRPSIIMSFHYSIISFACLSFRLSVISALRLNIAAQFRSFFIPSLIIQIRYPVIPTLCNSVSLSFAIPSLRNSAIA